MAAWILTPNEVEAVHSSVYAEVVRPENQKAEVQFKWQLRNASDQKSWSNDMQLVPVTSFPKVQINAESIIAAL